MKVKITPAKAPLPRPLVYPCFMQRTGSGPKSVVLFLNKDHGIAVTENGFVLPSDNDLSWSDPESLKSGWRPFKGKLTFTMTGR